MSPYQPFLLKGRFIGSFQWACVMPIKDQWSSSKVTRINQMQASIAVKPDTIPKYQFSIQKMTVGSGQCIVNVSWKVMAEQSTQRGLSRRSLTGKILFLKVSDFMPVCCSMNKPIQNRLLAQIAILLFSQPSHDQSLRMYLCS